MKNGSDYPRNTALAFLLAGNPGSGKCHGKGTPILMYDGTIKPVEEVQVGDELMGDDSTPRIVLSLATGEDALYSITPLRGGDPFTVNKEHVMVFQTSPTTQKPNRQILEMPLSQFLWLRESKPHRAEKLKLIRSGVVHFAPHQRQNIDPYFIGLWLGDGTSTKTEITTPDTEIIDYLYKFALGWNLQVRVYQQPDNKAAQYFLTNGTNNNPLREAMFHLGLLGNKHIPPCLLQGDIETRMHLLAGLLDSDGHYSNGTYEITQKRTELAQQIAYLARSLGYSASLRPKTGQIASIGFVGHYWRVTIAGISKGELPIRILRKKAKLRKINKDHRVSGFNVASLGRGQYYGFTLSGNGRYLLGDFTITHNTTACFAFPDPFILDCEGNLKSGIERNPGKRFWWDNPEVLADGKPTPIHERWTRAEALVKEAATNPEVKTIVVDGLGRMTTYLKDYLPHIAGLAGEKIPVLAGQKQMTLQLWGIYESKLGEFVMMLKSLGRPVVVTCHVKVDENELSMVKEQRVDMQGRLSGSFAKFFTDFWLLRAEPSSDARYKESGGVRYYIRTAPTSRIELKSHNNKVIPAEMELGDPSWQALIKSLTPEVKPISPAS